MQGILRVIPTPASRKAHRLLIMRQAPSPLLIEAIVGGGRQIVEGFDSTLHGGRAVPCVVYYRSEAFSEPNPFANLLWLQALVRRHGFADTHTPSSISGSVAMLFGDETFMRALAF
jgi:hypothetical protein